MTYKENITAILECCFAGFKEEIIEAACNRILELEPFINKDCVSKGACHEDKNKVLDKISAEIENQVKTNAEKFKEVFGFKPFTNNCINGEVKESCANCQYFYDYECDVQNRFWGAEYNEKIKEGGE